MAGSRKPGPLGAAINALGDIATDIALMPLKLMAGYWECGPDGKHRNLPGAIGACPPWIKHPSPKTVRNIRIHVMFTDWRLGTKLYENLLRGVNPPPNDNNYHEEDSGYWQDVTVTFVPYESDADRAKALFKSSLGIEGAIVVYLGHSALHKKRKTDPVFGPAYGIFPKKVPGREEYEPDYPATELNQDLKKSKAALVIIAGCDSKSLKSSGGSGPIVIATDSGKENYSYDTDMAYAVLNFLLTLRGLNGVQRDQRTWSTARNGGYGSIREALLEANQVLAATIKKDDRFVLVSGDDSTQLFR